MTSLVFCCLLLSFTFSLVYAQEEDPKLTLITNVSVWDGTGNKTINAGVLIEGNKFKQVFRHLVVGLPTRST